MDLKLKAMLAFLAAPILLGLFLFVPAGTLDYWEAWAYMAILLIPMLFVVLYFMKKDPEFLKRRMKYKEKEARQDLIIKAGGIVYFVGFLIPGLDKRFGWSSVPFEIIIIADIMVFLGYALIFLTFKENSYAGRTVQVEKGQKVVTTGPYSIIRHPMYLGTLLLYILTPIALGSYIAVPIFLLFIPVIIFRILNEEEVLTRELKGYKEYCIKTKYRLLPFIW
ncbi:isoprenylcysteine carboxylmethyltransferase family protein [Candidatus Micrarchaeota archaeon]|nr:isoprenylcysteine carboxylmethyltransferase family protein [Candidatus Micrarchaeota archaeon]